MARPGDYGSFVETTSIWDDIQRIQSIDVNSPEFKDLLVRLHQNVNTIALILNTKDSGYYDNSDEFVNGQLFFPDPALSSNTQIAPIFRQPFRKIINFGALPNAGLKSVAHGINPNGAFTFTRIYGTASDTTGLTYIPLPFASPVLNENIKLDVDAVNVNVTTGINRTNYNICYIVLEYLKN